MNIGYRYGKIRSFKLQPIHNLNWTNRPSENADNQPSDPEMVVTHIWMRDLANSAHRERASKVHLQQIPPHIYSLTCAWLTCSLTRARFCLQKRRKLDGGRLGRFGSSAFTSAKQHAYHAIMVLSEWVRGISRRGYLNCKPLKNSIAYLEM